VVKVAGHVARVDFPVPNTTLSIFVMRLVVLTLAHRCLACHKRTRSIFCQPGENYEFFGGGHP
jgi:hypothetical protein